MRGVDFYNIPTTVLSQVDSSIGGKVAIDFEGYKNIVGAFYPPKAVIIDSDTLKTLPPRQISNGLAESVKMALTSDSELFELFETQEIMPNIDRIIEKSLKIKRFVVEQDEKEGGLRKILNFGHTLAHAIESENEMQNLYHGECVALGMLPMCESGVKTRLIKVLEKLNLPTSINYDTDKVIEAMRHDKKMSGDKITVVYVPGVGTYEMKTMPFDEFKGMIS
jgi:3-dehydroquinate synthase